MIQSCPTCPLKFNDDTIKACPKCNPPSQIRSTEHAELKHACAACGALFVNDRRWWECHGNYCAKCVSEKLNPRAAAEKAPKRLIVRGRYEQLFLERYDKMPTGMELEDFKSGLRAVERARVMDKGEADG